MRKNPSVFMADLNDMTVVQKTREVMESDTSNAEFYFECASAAWDYLNEACRKSLIMTARDVEKLRESLRRAEQEAAESAIDFKKCCENQQRWAERKEPA